MWGLNLTLKELGWYHGNNMKLGVLYRLFRIPMHLYKPGFSNKYLNVLLVGGCDIYIS